MNIGNSHNPSYGWRSILASRPILQQGIRKKIGDGHDTLVWDEPWLPVTPARPPKRRGNHHDPDLRVHHLIDNRTKTWDTNLLNEFVSPEDIPIILSIRISRTGKRDCVSWDHTKSGFYTVKSGYDRAVEMRTSIPDPPISEPSFIALKKATWKQKTPRKLQHFMWNAISGFVATAEQLKFRHCAQDSVCVRCGAETESINHTLFECPPALQCWALSSIPTSPGYFPCSSVYSNFDFLFFRARTRGVSTQQLEAFPWIMWYIWKARNEKVFNNKDIDPLDTVQIAMKEAESWKVAQIAAEIVEVGGEDLQVDANRLRTIPVPGRWTCQVDASWIDPDNETGIGFVLFDDKRPTLFGAKGNFRTASPLHAEAEGIIWTLQELLRVGRREVHLQSDCEQLVKLILTDMEWPAFGP